MQGLIANSTVRLITDELARLSQEAERAERAAERWQESAARLDAQRVEHRAEDDKAAAAVTAAEAQAERVRAEVAAPLIVQAGRMAPLTSPPSRARRQRVLASRRWGGSVGASLAPSITS